MSDASMMNDASIVDTLAPMLRGILFDGAHGPVVHGLEDGELASRLASAPSGSVLTLGDEDFGAAARQNQGRDAHQGRGGSASGGPDIDSVIERVREKLNAHRESHGKIPAAVALPGRCALFVDSTYDRVLESLRLAGAERTLDGQGPGSASGAGSASAPGSASELAGQAAGGVPSPEEVIGQRGQVVENKVCVVTGGAQGFGAQIVRGLTAAGALVFVLDLNAQGASDFSQQMNQRLKRKACIPVKADVSDEESMRRAVQEIVRTAGGVDLFVSNAGVLKAGSVKELSFRDFTLVTSVNYIGFFVCSKTVSPILELQNRAAERQYFTDIIEINSKSGLEGSNKNGAYAGSKFGGIGLVQSFAKELIEDNVKVNAVCPGNFFEGPLWSDPETGLFVQYLNAGKVPGAQRIEDVKRFYESKVPMKRGCLGADVVRAIFYCIEQRYETGQAVPVTGGQVMLS